MPEYLISSEALRKLLFDQEYKRTYSRISIGGGSLFVGLGGALDWWSLGGIKSTDFSDVASDLVRNPLFNPIKNPGLIIDKAVEKFSGLYEFLHGPAGVVVGTTLALAGLYLIANEIIWMKKQHVVNSREGPVYYRLNEFTNNPWRFDRLADKVHPINNPDQLDQAPENPDLIAMSKRFLGDFDFMMKNYITVIKALLRRTVSGVDYVFVNGVQLERPPEQDPRTSRYTANTIYKGVPIRATTYDSNFEHVLDDKPDNYALHLMGELYRSDGPRKYKIRLQRFGDALPAPSSLAA